MEFYIVAMHLHKLVEIPVQSACFLTKFHTTSDLFPAFIYSLELFSTAGNEVPTTKLGKQERH